MASTRTIADVAAWASTFTKLAPIIGVGGFQSEPALTIANNTIQEMIQAPFNWPFNSADAPPFTTVYCTSQPPTCSFTQDYLVTLTDVQWIESAEWTDNLSTQLVLPTDIIQVVQTLQKTADVGPPEKLAKRMETDQGFIIRLWPIPPISYQWKISFTYQKKAPIKQGLQETWAPFPDELAYVYNQGFLAMAYKQADDPRYVVEYQKFRVLMQQALGINDMEANMNGFYPGDGLYIG